MILIESFNGASHPFNSRNNGPVLLFKTIFRHCNCFLSSVVKDDKNGHEVKLEKVGL